MSCPECCLIVGHEKWCSIGKERREDRRSRRAEARSKVGAALRSRKRDTLANTDTTQNEED